MFDQILDKLNLGRNGDNLSKKPDWNSEHEPHQDYSKTSPNPRTLPEHLSLSFKDNTWHCDRENGVYKVQSSQTDATSYHLS